MLIRIDALLGALFRPFRRISKAKRAPQLRSREAVLLEAFKRLRTASAACGDERCTVVVMECDYEIARREVAMNRGVA